MPSEEAADRLFCDAGLGLLMWLEQHSEPGVSGKAIPWETPPLALPPVSALKDYGISGALIAELCTFWLIAGKYVTVKSYSSVSSYFSHLFSTVDVPLIGSQVLK